jgi:hypothetical protein
MGSYFTGISIPGKTVHHGLSGTKGNDIQNLPLKVPNRGLIQINPGKSLNTLTQQLIHL